VEADAGKNDAAVRELKLAIKLAPNDIKAHYRLARLYQAMGRKQEASLEFEKTKTLTEAADETVFSQLKKAGLTQRGAEGAPRD
jgi:Tfp pilus assembly protein PilF